MGLHPMIGIVGLSSVICVTLSINDIYNGRERYYITVATEVF